MSCAWIDCADLKNQVKAATALLPSDDMTKMKGWGSLVARMDTTIKHSFALALEVEGSGGNQVYILGESWFQNSLVLENKMWKDGSDGIDETIA